MSSGNWERVGKSKLNLKGQRRQVTDKMPKHNTEVEPLKVSKSMFGAFEEVPKGEAGNAKQPLQDRSNIQASPKSNKKPKKVKKTTPAQFRYDRFEDAIKDVSEAAIYERATEQRKVTRIWQKDIARLLNDTISCRDDSLAFLERDFRYPLSKVPNSMRLMLEKLFTEETSGTIRQLLFDHCMLMLMDFVGKDSPTWGYILCAQVLAHNDPEACVNDLERDLEKILNMKNFPKRCLTYMWALGQVGVGDPLVGMKVWLDVMLPLIGVKNLANYVVHYLETLIVWTDKPQKLLSGTINADQFLLIMKYTFDPSTGLPPNLRERLQAIYKTLRTIATGTGPLKVKIFERFLRTPIVEIIRVKPELMDVTVKSLQSNPRCFEAWREMYPSSLPPTKLLLEYLEERWNETADKLPKKEFAATVLAFYNTNVNAASQSSSMTSAPEFKTISMLCKDFCIKIQSKSNRKLAPRCNIYFVSAIVALLGVVIGLIFYDVNLHGGFEQSAFYQTLESSGVLLVLNQAWTRLSAVLGRVVQWLKTNVPPYWTSVTDVLGPYVASVGVLLRNAFHWIMETTAPLRVEIATYTRYCLLWVEAGFQKALAAAQDAYIAFRPTLIVLTDWMWDKALLVYSFLSGEIGWCCIKEAVLRYSFLAYEGVANACLYLWSCVLYIFKMASDYVAGENM